jgi:hypothetical protein
LREQTCRMNLLGRLPSSSRNFSDSVRAAVCAYSSSGFGFALVTLEEMCFYAARQQDEGSPRWRLKKPRTEFYRAPRCERKKQPPASLKALAVVAVESSSRRRDAAVDASCCQQAPSIWIGYQPARYQWGLPRIYPCPQHCGRKPSFHAPCAMRPSAPASPD